MMGGVRNPWRGWLVAFLAASLIFSSGCALLLLGAGGTAGYLIKKGEEGEGPEKKGISEPQTKSSSEGEVKEKRGSFSEGKGSQKLVAEPGGTP